MTKGNLEANMLAFLFCCIARIFFFDIFMSPYISKMMYHFFFLKSVWLFNIFWVKEPSSLSLKEESVLELIMISTSKEF